MTVVEQDRSTIPGALEIQTRRELESGALIEFEFAPAGWLTQKGEVRYMDWRAYYLTLPGELKRKRLPSVTTLLSAIVPKDLTRWGEEQGIRGAVEALRRGLISPDSTDDFAVGQVRAAKLGSDAARDRAAGRGVDAHALVEDYLLNGRTPDRGVFLPEHIGFVKAVTRWLLKADPEPVAVEYLVASPADGYAGRMDLRARIDGKLVTVDFKTNPRAAIWDASHLQCAMYERAAVACGDEPADECRLVVFAEDGSFREMDCLADDDAVEAALAWYRALKPIGAACMSANRVERKAREAVA